MFLLFLAIKTAFMFFSFVLWYKVPFNVVFGWAVSHRRATSREVHFICVFIYIIFKAKCTENPAIMAGY
jgi:hypothetical protein